ncbi:MAG: dipeptide epimerase, partial [Acidobacteria bacterium]|nr:dipeptide epimerase [Acidobacteriota bacterium]
MHRRTWLKAMTAAAAMPLPGRAAPAAVETKIVRLRLRNTWTTVMSSSDYRDNMHLRFTAGGVTGVGEAAPIVRYHEDAESARRAADSVRDLLASADPWQFSKVMAEVFRRVEGQYAAKAAIDIALMDWAGQKLGVPLYRYFGLDPR